MGLLARLRMTRDVLAAPTFEVDQDSIDPALFGLPSWTSALGVAPRVSRANAIQVPAVKRARDMIAGTLGSLPLCLIDGDRKPVQGITSSLVEQPERDVPRSVTLTNTFDDMLFEGHAYWYITKFGWHGYPVEVKRLDPRSVDIREDNKAYVTRQGVHGMTHEFVPDSDLIRFYSPNDPLLFAGARAIRTLLKLDLAADRYADEPMPSGYFAPAEGADPAEDDEITDVLDAWKTARNNRTTGYVPAALKYNTVQFSPADMQLVEARQHAVVQIANLTGIDAEDLGVSTTSRTYANSEDRTQALINQTLGGYKKALEDRLSMGDVTPRGYRASLDLDDLLKADTLARMQANQIALATEIKTLDEVRTAEGLPSLPPKPKEAPVAPVPPALPAAPVPAAIEAPAASLLVDATFEDIDVVTFEDTGSEATFSVDLEKRTIRGLAVPYGKVATSRGRKWSFSKGSLTYVDPSRVKLLVQHDFSQAVGKAISFEDTDAGLFPVFKVARGDAGDRALLLAEDGVLDGLSVGIANGGTYDERDGVYHAVKVPLAEVSLTPSPAFDDARVMQVAASNERNDMTITDVAAAAADTTTKPEGSEPAAAPTFSAETIEAITAFATALGNSNERQVVSVAGGPALSVTEPALYRFDGYRREYDFSTDLIASLSRNDSEAAARMDKFMAAQFNIATADVDELNPNRQRPDLYVDQKDFTTPVWDAINKGGLTDGTPFVLPKFSAASGLVADHSAGVEPTTGAFTTTAQTITPKAKSGRVDINREVWDQGGSPQLSGLLWNQIMRSWNEALEAYAVSILDAATPTGITITTAAVDGALDAIVTAEFAKLQYIRGGFRMRDFFVQVDLYKALVGAVDDNGRHLFPMLNPQNANGSTDPFFSSVMVGGLTAKPAWALAATGSVAASSYLFDRQDVSGWATTPSRITMENNAVATVSLGVWGYCAAAITDLTGVREVIYDPS